MKSRAIKRRRAEGVNHAPKAAIEPLVVGGFTVQLFLQALLMKHNDELSEAGACLQITVSVIKTAEIIEVAAPEASEKQPSSSPRLVTLTATTNRPLNSACSDGCACAISGLQPEPKRR